MTTPEHDDRPSTTTATTATTATRPPSRLSGFFTNLIHRRDNTPTIQEEPDRSNSTPPPLLLPPPPPLPPPSLHELGLALNVLTDSLSPAHFSTAPSSGTFLAPHYLLLCHAQGLDVLPLVSPPAPQPYALVRRVSFKSVVVMEHRGVLVAIAGRRDGVRVYALEEVKKAVEWRIDVEIRKERERFRREAAKKTSLAGLDIIGPDRVTNEKPARQSLSTPPESVIRGKLARKASLPSTAQPTPTPTVPAPPLTPLVPRRPTTRSKRRPRTSPSVSSVPPSSSEPAGHPPPYSSPPESIDNSASQRLHGSPSIISLQARGRSGSVSNVLAASTFSRRSTVTSRNPDVKPDRTESSDDEAINVVAAGPSGSQALDERTSTVAAASPPAQPSLPSSPGTLRRNRPANLDLSLARPTTTAPSPEPSPAPTLATLRQTLSISPSVREARLPPESTISPHMQTPVIQPDDSNDEDENEGDGEISLAQALFESRRPELPPIGSRQPQQPILITQSHPIATGDDEPSSPRTSDAHSSLNSRVAPEPQPPFEPSRRRRWSVMLASTLLPSSMPPISSASSPALAPSTASTPSRSARHSPSSHSLDGRVRPSPVARTPPDVPPLPPAPSGSFSQPNSGRQLRLIPRAISNVIRDHWSRDLQEFTGNRQPRRVKTADPDQTNKTAPNSSHAPPPKLEYVKLPGTKGALIIKAVETARKSFFAILCGENGEKVELFAGTYRSALGLSRTFILPDSPRSLELQLQGDDLVEVFLVFSQNVFGLEPATVRVREVRIGRAERRAARRRARELRGGEAASVNEPDANADDDTHVNVNIGVSVTVEARSRDPDSAAADTPAFIASQHPDQDHDGDQHTDPTPTPPNEPSMLEPIDGVSGSGGAPGSGAGTGMNTPAQHAEEVVALATAQMGPYTTFQQLSFAPHFPTAAIADEYIIPPTYPDFLKYRSEHEPEIAASNGMSGSSASEISVPPDLAQVQFSPPGLPIPTPSAPSKWFYRDPKGIVHGPWKASLMQAWYKDGLLPLDLPVKREEDADYTLLKDLRLQSVDPTHPFRTPSIAPSPSPSAPLTIADPSKPLLPPISLLSQPRHFGPPALFYSSRGGHSTAIVDSRGRPVLKGRFIWSADGAASNATQDGTDNKNGLGLGPMGDIRRLEAFDIRDRSVLVAMRQGGIEAVDLSDALLRPADASRTTLPNFDPPPSNVSRRGPFIWRIGTPVATSHRGTGATVLGGKRPGSAHHGYHNLGIGGRRSTPSGTSGLARSPASSKGEFASAEYEGGGVEAGEEMLFLGRKDDEVYICERNAATFRILRLSPEEA